MLFSASSTASSIDRKSIKKADNFLVTLQKSFDAASKKGGIIGVFLLVLVAIGVGAGFWMSQRAKTNQAAAGALFLAHESLDKQMEAIAGAQKPLEVKAPKIKDPKAPPMPEQKPDISTLKFDVDAKLSESVGLFQNLIQTYPKTHAAYEATLVLGDVYYLHGEPAKAITWYQKGATSGSSYFERALAYYSLGYAYEDTKKYDDAIQAFQKGVELGVAGLKGELLLGVARNYTLKNDKAKARSTYEQIAKELASTIYEHKADTLKAQLDK